MVDGKLFAEQDRGARANALLRNELLSESFSILEDEYIEAWKSSPVRDEEGREKIFQMIQALRSVKQNLEEVAMTGKLASMQINKTE